MSYLTHLECTKCGRRFQANKVQTICDTCHKPLFARYELDSVKEVLTKRDIAGRESSMWRYFELLPVREKRNVVTLGEGWTPLTPLQRLGNMIGLPDSWVKDEGLIPTGTFKSRGLAVAVSKAKELGVTKVALPSAGNAAGAASAYGARAGMEVFVFMPVDTPKVNVVESMVAGANIVLVRGLITDASKIVSDNVNEMGWFSLSTLREPYRVEGKKTMGIEVAEQMNWELPQVIIYPTGGGTGIIGMWKAFDELERLGWIGSERPRMVSVQAEGCAPIAQAYREGKEESTYWEGARTVATGLRVPKALGDFLILRTIRESGGTAIAVSDDEIMDSVRLMAKTEGIFTCPEGGATLAALKHMIEDGLVDRDERVVLFNTGTGLKYTELFEVDVPIMGPSEKLDYGGL